LKPLRFPFLTLIGLSLISVTSPAVATTLPASHLDTIAHWARSNDPLKDEYLPEAKKGWFRTRMGAVLKPSCVPFADRIESALTTILTQSWRCQKHIGFQELSSILPMVRRAQIDCKKMGDSVVATHDPEHLTRNDSRWALATARFDHRYEVSLNTIWAADQQVDIAAPLFHEFLHMLSTSNREWHNESTARARWGCQSSLFEDRIYLIQAACFPYNFVTTSFYDPFMKGTYAPYHCTQACESALTEVDTAVIQEDARLRKTGSIPRVGPSDVAIPYAASQAKDTCARIVDLADRFYSGKATEEEKLFWAGR